MIYFDLGYMLIVVSDLLSLLCNLNPSRFWIFLRAVQFSESGRSARCKLELLRFRWHLETSRLMLSRVAARNSNEGELSSLTRSDSDER